MSNQQTPARARKRLRDERADATRKALIAAAAELFERHGYAATSLDDVAAATRTTKGAVYHHFADKRALFREVYAALAANVATKVVEEIGSADFGVQAVMKRATRAFLREAAVGRGRRVLFQEGMMVLGGVECRAIDAEYGLGLIKQFVEAATEPGLLRTSSSDVIARLLLALLIEAGQIIGSASDPEKTTKQVERVFSRVLDSLRASA